MPRRARRHALLISTPVFHCHAAHVKLSTVIYRCALTGKIEREKGLIVHQDGKEESHDNSVGVCEREEEDD